MSNTSISPTAVAQQAEPVALAVPATTNRYGLDTPYLVRWLNRVVPALENYTPAEFAREFGRMAAAADKEALLADQLPAAAQAQQAECGSCDGFNSGCEECCGLGKDGHLAALRQLANVSHRVAHAMGMPTGFDVTTLPDVVVQRLAAAPQAAVAVPGALADIAAERRRQVEVEGWTHRLDDQNQHGQMAIAAACYAMAAHNNMPRHKTDVPTWWPWDAGWWEPTTARGDLVKAGALIVTEIERIDRADAKKKGGAA